VRLLSRIWKKAIATVAVGVLSVAPPAAARAASTHENHMRTADMHESHDANHRRDLGTDHDRDRDHHSPYHPGRWPNGTYYIYPYRPYRYGWTYRYAPAPTYWYYCPSYGAYHPYVSSCPGSWVVVPGS